MEYASGGELFDYIVSKTKLSELDSCKFYQQIISGVEYIHKLGVVHRDLKPENLLLDENNNIKIVDFGLSNTYKAGELLQTACGSPCYAAPEMIAGNKYVGSRVDLWSTGVILFAMLSGYLPFEDPNTAELYKKILNCDYESPAWISSKTQEFLSKVLNTDPDARFTISQIKAHPWFNQVKVDNSEGIIVGYSAMPINTEILGYLEAFGIDQEHCQKCLEANKHNDVTTTYYLLMKKHRASLGVAQTPTHKQPQPPILPFAPLMNNEFRPMLRHRKYIEKKIGNGDREREREKSGRADKGEGKTGKRSSADDKRILRDKSLGSRNIRSRGYISAGKYIKNGGWKNSTLIESKKLTGLKTEKIRIFKSPPISSLNRSYEGRRSFLNSSFKQSPKNRDSNSNTEKSK
jgi:5'-AMP-activated protein kinase catalytic alpha subunit